MTNTWATRWAIYGADPVLMFKSAFGMMCPPKLSEAMVWIAGEARAGRMIRAILLGPRGGGKSALFASLEFWLWRFLDWDITNLGGSQSQADKVYSYLTRMLNSADLVPIVERTIQSETVKRQEAGKGWIRVLAASQKQVRSPHAGERGRGGALMVDEVCEADDDLIRAAHPIVNTADPSAILYSSTFHKAFGEFQSRLDAGLWKLFKWDCFDISERCDYPCKGKRWQDGVCPVLDYCQGRAHKAQGWMRIDEIIQARIDHDREWFEVEMMGMRPSTGGLVYDPMRIKELFGGQAPGPPGAKPAIGIDWGFAGETALIKTSMRDGLVWVDTAEFWSHTPDTEIIDFAVALAKVDGAEILPDASHPFQNDALRRKGVSVREVAFAQEKERGIGNVRALMEIGALRIPDASAGHRKLYSQLINYRRDERTGKPVKKDDHGPDALLCACLRYDPANVKSPRVLSRVITA